MVVGAGELAAGLFVAVGGGVDATDFGGAGAVTAGLVAGWGEASAGLAEAGVITAGVVVDAGLAALALERE